MFYNKKRENKKPVVAYKILHPLFVAIPLITGLDKFVNKITVWERYVSPLVPVNPSLVMRAAGVAEVAIGLATVKNPRVGSVLFAGVLGGIILNLLTLPKEKHIALLDSSLMVCALAFASLLPADEKE